MLTQLALRNNCRVLQMKIGELEIGQDLKFQRRSWGVERAGWIIGAFILFAALLGLFGPGPLSKARAASPDRRLSVEYHKLEHYRAPVHLRIDIDSNAASNGQIQLWINRDYVEALDMEHIDPEPESVEINEERLVYLFKAQRPPATSKILFRFEPNKFGKTFARVGLVNGPELQFTQFYFP
jgi:hypothetical protein